MVKEVTEGSKATQATSIPVEETKKSTHSGREFKKVKAGGIGSDMATGFGRSLFAAGALFAAVMTAIAVGVSSASLAQAGITLGVGIGITFVMTMLLKKACPSF